MKRLEDIEFNFEILKKEFGNKIKSTKVNKGQAEVEVNAEGILDILRFLKEDHSYTFDFLTDLTAVDLLKFPDASEAGRFVVIYQLYSFQSNIRLRLKANLPAEAPQISSSVSLWNAANWLEREVFDMYGIVFDGHPDLRRILMPSNYEGHPLRKDYPLQGRGERANFRRYTREEDD